MERKLVHGTEEDLAAGLAQSTASTHINTSFVERQNGTDRTYNARKARKTYELSKDLTVHMAVTWWVYFCYNFHHLHRGLRIALEDGTWLNRTPAMVIGLADAPLSIEAIVSRQVVGFVPPRIPSPKHFRLTPLKPPAPHTPARAP